MRYDYKKPSSINWVTVSLVLLLVALVYAGWKFGPVFWQAQKVDQALDELKLQVADIQSWSVDQRRDAEAKLIAKATERLRELGIEDHDEQPIQIWFSSDYRRILARYMVVVRHPFGPIWRTTRITMNRDVAVPTARAL
jgi:hypothetical protein